MLLAPVFNATLIFIVRKSWVGLENLDHSSMPAHEAVNPDRIRRTVSAFVSSAVQTCQRHFMKAIIPFIPLMAAMRDGHEESVN
jgi:hypothetical protein